MFYVPGEHDFSLDDGALYKQRYGKGTVGNGWYSYNHKGVHFVGLNNCVQVDAMGNLGAEQLAWLKSDLAGLSASTPIVVFAHIPLWCASTEEVLLFVVRAFLMKKQEVIPVVWSIPNYCSHIEVFRIMLPVRSGADIFEPLALPLLPSLYSHAFWLARNHADAEDLVQETISKALRVFDSFEVGSNFNAWIFQILRTTFLTSGNCIASSRTIFIEDLTGSLDVSDGRPTPEEHFINFDSQAKVLAALDQLPQPLREVLFLCDIEELKYKDIALILGVPIRSVMSRVSRARIALREILRSKTGKPV